VHLHADAWELGKNYPTRVALLGDPKVTLPELGAAISARMTGAGTKRAGARLERWRLDLAVELAAIKASAASAAERQPIHPPALLHALGESLPSDVVIVDESISSRGSLQRLLKTSDAAGFFGLRGGAIGWGLPAAIGVKLALPRRPVVALIGDGSALYTVQALWTAAHDRVPAVFVILDNASYLILKQRHRVLGGDAPGPGGFLGLDLTDPCVDFVALAEGFGVAACRATTVAGACAATAGALAAGVPTLIDVAIDRSSS
jgi:benzoylformate decarboxylase